MIVSAQGNNNYKEENHMIDDGEYYICEVCEKRIPDYDRWCDEHMPDEEYDFFNHE